MENDKFSKNPQYISNIWPDICLAISLDWIQDTRPDMWDSEVRILRYPVDTALCGVVYSIHYTLNRLEYFLPDLDERYIKYEVGRGD